MAQPEYDQSMIFVNLRSHGTSPVIVQIDNSVQVELLKIKLREMLHLPLDCAVTLSHRCSELRVDDLACVRELGLKTFDTLTVSAPHLKGGMLSKNRKDGSDSDEQYH